MHDDDGDNLAGHKFWTAQKIILVIAFLLGALIGGIVTHKFVDGAQITSISQDSNSLSQDKRVIEERNDILARCLRSNGIEPDTCN